MLKTQQVKSSNHSFDEWVTYLDEQGYNTYWKVMNAKDYGIPQNRERVFAISVLKDSDTGYDFQRISFRKQIKRSTRNNS